MSEVRLPKDVQAKIDKANKHYNKDQTSQPPVETPANQQPAFTQQPKLADTSVTKEVVNIQQPRPTGAPAPAPAPAPVTAAQPVVPVPDAPNNDPAIAQLNARIEGLMQEHRTLRGKYDAEVPALNSQIKERDATIKKLERDLAVAKAAPTLTAKDLEEYGTDMADFVGRIAEGKAATKVAELEGNITELRTELSNVRARQSNLAQTQGQNLVQSVLTHLDGAFPDWRRLNTDPAFISWVKQPDMLSGVIRKTLLDKAVNEGDAARALAFFKAYAQETGSAAQPRPSMDTFAEPPPGRQAPQGVPQDQANVEYVSRARIQEFNRMMANGSLARQYTQAQIAETQAKIDLAVAEGRLVP